VLAGWSLSTGTPLVMVGAAGGKRRPQAVEASDLSLTTHDPLLASLRQRVRKYHGGARTGLMGLRCVFSREPVMQPEAAVCEPVQFVTGTGDTVAEPLDNDGSLNCHGYGSSVTVTATFGMVAASEALEAVMAAARQPRQVGVAATPNRKPLPEALPSSASTL
jgi:tRNA A37 threonylcarbamoyladenosine dehydratase